MADVNRYDIARGLRCIRGDEIKCNDCAYSVNGYGVYGCRAKCAADAIELLKNQEPVKPRKSKSGGGATWYYVCGVCMKDVDPNDKYCRKCGRAINWNM